MVLMTLKTLMAPPNGFDCINGTNTQHNHDNATANENSAHLNGVDSVNGVDDFDSTNCIDSTTNGLHGVDRTNTQRSCNNAATDKNRADNINLIGLQSPHNNDKGVKDDTCAGMTNVSTVHLLVLVKQQRTMML